jgi:hypothetical protein
MWQAQGEAKYKWGFGFKMPQTKGPLRTLRRKWKDIKVELKEIGWEGVDWLHQTEDTDTWRAVVKSIRSLPVPYNAGNFLTS